MQAWRGLIILLQDARKSSRPPCCSTSINPIRSNSAVDERGVFEALQLFCKPVARRVKRASKRHAILKRPANKPNGLWLVLHA